MSSILVPRARPPAAAAPVDAFRPSDYTGLLLHALRSRAQGFGRGMGLDMGTGSGVLLATLGLLGVECIYGVDIDPDAIAASERLVRELGLFERTRLLQGSLWEPLGDEQFDVVVANLPNFAACRPSDPDHSRYWSVAGPNGRKLIDPFLAGLGDHLRETGVAFMTHNVFAGLEETEDVLHRHGLSARAIMATVTVLHPVKSDLLNPDVRTKYTGSAISRLGPYEFADVQVLEIRPIRSL
jgi:release factor glutamine methyltransferase